jgi:hypothetical protein
MPKPMTAIKYFVLIILVLIFFRYKDVGFKALWVKDVTDNFSTSLCRHNHFSGRMCFGANEQGCRQCFNVSAKECHELVVIVVDACSNQHSKSLQFLLWAPKDSTTRFSIVTECIGVSFENALNQKYEPDEYCSDPET